MKTSLIISTYNRPDALAVVLDSVTKQSVVPYEIIIADDGSAAPTRRLVQEWESDPVIGSRIRYVWHEDDGFRLAAIRNRAIAAATGDYIIQIDGDVMLHPRFVEDHIRCARPGFMVKGSRVYLTKEFTEKLCHREKSVRMHPWSRGIGRCRQKAVRLHWFSNFFRDRFKPHSYWALGCNMAFWRDDALAENGYDESFRNWGHEDSDLFFRMARAGVRKCDLRYAGIIYHLDHKSGGDGLGNLELLRRRNAENTVVRAVEGIDKYL